MTTRRLRVITPLLLALVGGALSGQAEGASISIDPGAIGTTFLSGDFDLDDLSGTPFDGATRSLDVDFGGKFLAVPSLSIQLFVNQAGDIGTWPSSPFIVSSYLVDAAGNAVTSPVDLHLNVEMPAQIWPGWDFYLPDGTQYLPATTGYGADLAGTVTPATDQYSLIDPLLFWGIHFELLYPDSLGDSAIGGRLQLSNYAGFNYPISISPDPVPQYVLAVPEPSTLALWVSGLLPLLSPVVRRHRRRGRRLT